MFPWSRPRCWLQRNSSEQAFHGRVAWLNRRMHARHLGIECATQYRTCGFVYAQATHCITQVFLPASTQSSQVGTCEGGMREGLSSTTSIGNVHQGTRPVGSGFTSSTIGDPKQSLWHRFGSRLAVHLHLIPGQGHHLQTGESKSYLHLWGAVASGDMEIQHRRRNLGSFWSYGWMCDAEPSGFL